MFSVRSLAVVGALCATGAVAQAQTTQDSTTTTTTTTATTVDTTVAHGGKHHRMGMMWHDGYGMRPMMSVWLGPTWYRAPGDLNAESRRGYTAGLSASTNLYGPLALRVGFDYENYRRQSVTVDETTINPNATTFRTGIADLVLGVPYHVLGIAPYIFAGAGLSAWSRDTVAGTLPRGTTSGSETAVVFDGGAGLRAHISPRSSIFGEIAYTEVMLHDNDTHLMPVKIGFSFAH